MCLGKVGKSHVPHQRKVILAHTAHIWTTPAHLFQISPWLNMPLLSFETASFRKSDEDERNKTLIPNDFPNLHNGLRGVFSRPSSNVQEGQEHVCTYILVYIINCSI